MAIKTVLFTDDDQLFEDDDNWEVGDHEETTKPESSVRRLTYEDIKLPEGVGEIDAGYWLSMSCKIILQNPFKVYENMEIKAKVLELWPKFHVTSCPRSSSSRRTLSRFESFGLPPALRSS